MQRSYFAAYLRAVLAGGPDMDVGTARNVFEGEALERLRNIVTDAALDTPITFTDNLSDRTFACIFGFQDGSRLIAVNVRFQVDPEIFAYSMAEEIIHAQQLVDGADPMAERHLPYPQRQLEKEAQNLATQVVGYDPGPISGTQIRREPTGVLYDRVLDKNAPSVRLPRRTKERRKGDHRHDECSL